MRMLKHILSVMVLLLAGMTAVSCLQKENAVADEQKEEMTRISVNLDLGAEITVKSGETQGNNISSIKVWIYKYTDGAIQENAYPIGYAQETFDDSNSSRNLQMDLPTALLGNNFRFLAIANADCMGEIYKARQGYSDIEEELELGAAITYKTLVTAVFDAEEGGIMNTFPKDELPERMPLSHWVDVYNLNGSTPVNIPLYRSVAKTVFNAKLKNEGATVRITGIKIKSAHNYDVPKEGFVFSSIENFGTATGPAVFGEYSDVFVDVSDIPLFNNDNGGIKFNYVDVTSTTPVYVGSSFLYENFFGQESGNTGSPNDYNTGAYYMEIDYSYGATGDEKTAKGYIPLPKIVRNSCYNIDATFNINVDGNVIISYIIIEEWENGGTENPGFKYPTFMISPIKTIPDSDPPVYDYSQPLAYYNKTEENVDDQKGFGFSFQIEGCDWWVVTIDNKDDFYFSVYKNGSTESENVAGGEFKVSENNGTPEKEVNISDVYKIIIYPKNPEDGNIKTTNVMIGYPASWLTDGQTDELLINSGGGGTLWSDSGGERYKIKVTQPASAQ